MRNFSFLRSFKTMFGVALLLAAAAGGVYLFRHNELVDGLIEYFTKSGKRELKENFRPNSGGTRILIFAFDGVGKDEFNEALRQGRTPRLRRILGNEQAGGQFEHAYSVPNILSILPSTTMAAWSSIFTGKGPAETGVPGNEWFDRETQLFYAPAPVSIEENDHVLKMMNDGLVGNSIKVPTLYEQLNLRSFVSFSPVYRGADLFTTPNAASMSRLSLAVAKGAASGESVSQKAYQEADAMSVDKLLEALKEYGIPRIQTVYFPGIDLYSHIADFPLEKQQDYFQNILDPAMGKVLDAYDKAGILDSTYILFIADHGHIPVKSDDRHALSFTGEHEPPALLRKLGFRVRENKLSPGDENYQAVLAYQGAIAYVYLANRALCGGEGQKCDWGKPPRMKEDVLAVADAFYKANAKGDKMPELKGTIDLVFAREPRPVGQNALPFRIYDGKKLVPIGEYLKRNPRPDLLRLEERMSWLAAGPYGHRAGDVLLLSKTGIEHPIEERFYFSAPYRSWHGSPTKQDSEVPLLIAKRDLSAERIRAIVSSALGANPSQLDFVPVVKTLAGGAAQTGKKKK